MTGNTGGQRKVDIAVRSAATTTTPSTGSPRTVKPTEQPNTPDNWWMEIWDGPLLAALPEVPWQLFRQCFPSHMDGDIDYQDCLCMKIQLWAAREDLG